MDRPQKITFGEMRAMGIRDVLIYCSDYKCSHHVEVSAESATTAAPTLVSIRQ